MKYMTIPTVFVSNLAVYILLGLYIDKKYDIGNYLVLFIVCGVFLSLYSTYKVLTRMVKHDD